HQALAGQARARLNDAARSGHEFDGNTGVDARSTARGNGEVFAGVEIVSDVLSGMRYGGQNSIRREPLHFQHEALLIHARAPFIQACSGWGWCTTAKSGLVKVAWM